MPKEQDTKQPIKRMANLLRQGSTLTELACPACASPLLRLRNGTLWCANCEKKVVVVSDTESATPQSNALSNLESTILTKIQDVQDKMQHEQNSEELQKLGATLSELLGNLKKIKELKKA